MKRCSRCGETKPVTEFHVRRASADGRSAACQTCVLAARRVLYDRRLADQGQERRYGRPVIDGRKECVVCREWKTLAAFYDRAANQCGACRSRLQTERRWQRLYPTGKQLALFGVLPQEERDRAVRAAAAWARANPERARRNALAATHRRRERLGGKTRPGVPRDVLRAKAAYWGNRCWVCKADADQIDHVKPLARGGLHVAANLRPICGICNRRKGAAWPFQTGRRIPLDHAIAALDNVRVGVPLDERDLRLTLRRAA